MFTKKFNIFPKKLTSIIPPEKHAKLLSKPEINQMLNAWYVGEIGVEEIGGRNRGPRVDYYNLTVDNIAGRIKTVFEPRVYVLNVKKLNQN